MRKICAFEKLKAVRDGVRKLRFIFVLQYIVVKYNISMVGKNIGHGGFMIEIKKIVKTYRPKETRRRD